MMGRRLRTALDHLHPDRLHVHEVHLLETKSAWISSEAVKGTWVGCPTALFPPATRPQPHPTLPEANVAVSPRQAAQEPSTTSQQQQLTSAEASEGSPEQVGRNSIAPRRSTRIRWSILRYGIKE
ncbi:hypothetical protein MRX96_040424 [Rhipicephalus microplus]